MSECSPWMLDTISFVPKSIPPKKDKPIFLHFLDAGNQFVAYGNFGIPKQ